MDLHTQVRKLLGHTSPPSTGSDRPLSHFERSINDGSLLLGYIRAHIDPAEVYGSVYGKHLGQLHRMILAEQIESLERFLKELAALCVDYLAPFTTDDRFDEFFPKRGDTVAAFVNASSVGRALCESDTWINNKTINSRFASLLKTADGPKWEWLFPEANQQPEVERARAATLAMLWQIRHTLAHNLGVLTHSDSMKFRVLIRGAVNAEHRLNPSSDDLRHVKRFLSETAGITNRRVGVRLAEVLGGFHSVDPGLFDAQSKADELSQRLAFSVTIHGRIGVA